MKDRNVEFPNRYHLTKVAGTDDIYDLTPAPGAVFDEGTFINKTTVLQDVTASLFGLNAYAVPDDLFSLLGKYNLHWWRMRGYGAHYETFIQESSNTTTLTSPDSSKTYYYFSDSIALSQTDGKISLVNPSSDYAEWGHYPFDKFAGKYVSRGSYENLDSVMKYGKDISISTSGTGSSIKTIITGERQTIAGGFVEETGAWQYIQSQDSEAYPKSGIVDNFEYQYLGIPFQNAVTAPKLATGSYKGTGTYGSSNPVKITCGFKPKFILITKAPDPSLYVHSDGGAINFFYWTEGMTNIMVEYAYISSWTLVYAYGTILDDGFSFYTNGKATYNASGTEYRFIALG